MWRDLAVNQSTLHWSGSIGRFSDRAYSVQVETGLHTRLRPIAMALLSTKIGSVPMILSDGAKAHAAIGLTIFAGLGLSSLITLFLAQVFYLLIARQASVCT